MERHDLLAMIPNPAVGLIGAAVFATSFNRW
jgi:hypothetical protein